MWVPGFLGIDHVAIAVEPGKLNEQVAMYESLGFVEHHREDICGSDQVREVFLRLSNDETAIQLLEPLTPESPISKLLARNAGRGGFAHIAYRVSDIRQAFDFMRQHGFEVIDPAPRPGSRGTTVFFVHPKSLGLGYLMEIVELRSSQTSPSGQPD